MSLRGLSVGIIADDLTGACDSALPFFDYGAAVQVLPDYQQLGQPLEETAQVWSLNTDSRHLSPKQAAERVALATLAMREQFGFDRAIKKIDSTCRGHVAWECLAAMEALQLACALIVPAYPAERRQTIGGYQLLRSRPIEQTEVARDPRFPVKQSHLPTLLSQQLAGTVAADWVGHVGLIDVLRGAGPLLGVIREQVQQGKHLLVVDACTPTDIEQIALCIAHLEKSMPVLPCGSAGLAKSLSRLWLSSNQTATLDPQSFLSLGGGPVVVISGSNTPLNRQQVQQVLDHPILGAQVSLIALTPGQLLQLDPIDEPVIRLTEALNSGLLPLITTALHRDSYEQTCTLGQEYDLTPAQVSGRVLEAIRQTCQPLLSGPRPLTAVLCGGETASHFCQFMQTQSLKIVGRVEHNVPVLLAHDGMTVVTKSGNFGDPLTLSHIIQQLSASPSEE